jgi:hypothetical protein
MFKTSGWLAIHIKSNHAVPVGSELRLASSSVVGAAEPELPPQFSPTPRGRRMTGIDSGDGWFLVLVVGPGCRPRNHHNLIGDNEYRHLGYQGLRQRPRTQGDA